MLYFVITLAVIMVVGFVLAHEIATLQRKVHDLETRTNSIAAVVPDIDDTIVERFVASQLENHAPPRPTLTLVPTELPCFDHSKDPYDWSKDPVLSQAFSTRGTE